MKGEDGRHLEIRRRGGCEREMHRKRHGDCRRTRQSRLRDRAPRPSCGSCRLHREEHPAAVDRSLACATPPTSLSTPSSGGVEHQGTGPKHGVELVPARAWSRNAGTPSDPQPAERVAWQRAVAPPARYVFSSCSCVFHLSYPVPDRTP